MPFGLSPNGLLIIRSAVTAPNHATAKLLYSARTRPTTVWMPSSISISPIITLDTNHTNWPGCLCVRSENKFEEANDPDKRSEQLDVGNVVDDTWSPGCTRN